MKPGEKYIIEIESVSKTPKGDIAFIKGFNALVFDQYGLNHLENLYSTARLKAEAKMRGDEYRRGFDDGTANQKLKAMEEIKAAYNRGLVDGSGGAAKTRNELLEAAYQDGLDDAWSMIRQMYSEMTIGTLRQIFNMPDVGPTNIMAIINAFPAAEVKKRLDAYEKEKEEGKQVPVNAYISLGDEVKFNPDNVTVIVTRLGYNFITGFDKHGDVHTYGLPCNWETTGRHFNLDPLFKFMGRKDDGPEL